MSMSMPEASAVHAATPPNPAPSVRAQILATEHWSLLATRSMTWSEVMSRIVIHLTVLSAGLVVLALMAQAQGFGVAFQVLSIGLTATALVLGTLTGLRVDNASDDDSAMIIGMNRLRNAYVDLDPGIEPYLITSRYDDARGMTASYFMGRRRSVISHVLASTALFIKVVNAIVAGVLGALIAATADASAWLTAMIGTGAGLLYLGVAMGIASRKFGANPLDSRFPSPAESTAG